MWNDPVVEETRKLRDEYASKHDYDAERIFADIQERQKRSGAMLHRRDPKRPPKNEAVSC